MTGFSNPIVGGSGALVYPAIKSPNFSAGPPLTGWSINKNGQAFFSTLELATPTLMLPSGFTGTIPATGSDATTLTATTTAVTRLTKQWDIPANDPAVSTVYRLTVWGNGSQGGTANNGSFSVTIGGVSIIALGVAGSAWTAGVSAGFRLQVELQFTAVGVSGNVNGAGLWVLTNSSTAAAIYAASLLDLTNTVNTTVDNKLQMNWQWSSTTTGPTISAYGSILERISS